MVRKSFSTQRHDYGNGPTCLHTEQEEMKKLRAAIEAAEQARLSGQPVYSMEESRNQLNQMIGK